MKKIFCLFLALSLAGWVCAQSPAAYFMEGTTLRSQLNPAFAPLRGYVNIPVLGGVEVSAVGNLSLDKLLYPSDGRLVTLLDSSIPGSVALSGLHDRNLLGTADRVNLIGFGAFRADHKTFWSFEINAHVDADANVPYSLFEFLKTGNDGSIANIGVNADSYLEAAFSYSFPLLDDRLYIGVRGKFLMGVARAKLHYDRFDVSLDGERWMVDASGEFDMSASGTEIEYTTDDQGRPIYKFDDIKPFDSSYAPSGYGFAVDLGATYDILPEFQASLAVNDIGFISWGKGNTTRGLSSKSMVFTGVEINADGVVKQPDFDLNILEFQPQESVGTTRMLRATINAGLEYNLWRHKIGFGLLYSARFRPFKTYHDITASVNYHPIRWFTLTGSYSMIGNQGGAVGLALNLCPNWINFFLATDVLLTRHTPQFLPINKSRMHATLGMAIPIGKRSHRIAAYIYPNDNR